MQPGRLQHFNHSWDHASAPVAPETTQLASFSQFRKSQSNPDGPNHIPRAYCHRADILASVSLATTLHSFAVFFSSTQDIKHM